MADRLKDQRIRALIALAWIGWLWDAGELSLWDKDQRVANRFDGLRIYFMKRASIHHPVVRRRQETDEGIQQEGLARNGAKKC